MLIGGLPAGIEDLLAPVLSLGTFFNVPISSSDISHVSYISKKAQILVKFNNVHARDCIMKEYFKTRSLKACDIMDGACRDLTNRVYLNEHYSPGAAYLNSICRKLQKQNIITKFKILNSHELKAKLMFPDGKVLFADVKNAASLLNESPDVST